MALLPKSGTPSLTTLTPCNAHQLVGIAGEVIAAGDACYFKASDGKVYRSIGTTLNAADAKVDGFAGMAAAVGKPVTLYKDVVMAYGANLTVGTRYFVALTAGQLDTVATAGGTGAVAKAVSSTEIEVFPSTY